MTIPDPAQLKRALAEAEAEIDRLMRSKLDLELEVEGARDDASREMRERCTEQIKHLRETTRSEPREVVEGVLRVAEITVDNIPLPSEAGEKGGE